MVIYNHFKFREIPLIDYIVMAPDGCDGWTAGHGEKIIPPPSAGIKIDVVTPN